MKNIIKSINPYTEELNAEFELFSDEQIEEKIKIAHKAFLEWKNTESSEKKRLFLKLAYIIELDIEQIAKLQTIEMWMLYHKSIEWLKWTINLIRWFANNFEEILSDEEFDNDWIKGKIMYDPLWIIFWIAPWNYPYNQVLRAAVPNILAWNTVIYKHASNVPICAEKIENLFLQAGFKKWIYTNMFVWSDKSEYILSNKYVVWVNLTGWELAWKSIWSLAWYNLKPSVLELWWNDPFLVIDNNDLDRIIDEWVKARISNWWQKCVASKRFIVLEKYYEEFCEKFTKQMLELEIWDPMDSNTQIPPLAKKDLVLDIEKQVSKTIDEWAILMTWWKILDKKWYFFAPTVLKDVNSEMTSYKEEIFWPVASIIKSSSIDESIAIANNSDYWLWACVYGDNIKQLREVASKIESWMVFINKPTWSKAFLPFWWIRKSWYWKENWPDWLKAFTNKKVILY